MFDLASRYRETFLYNKYLMAKHAIAEGQRRSLDDHAASDRRCRAALNDSAQAARRRRGRGGRGGRGRGAAARRRWRRRRSGGAVRSWRAARRADARVQRRAAREGQARSARLHHPVGSAAISSTAVKFVNTLRHVGVYVDQATAPFTVAGKQYPAGSFVIKINQAARAQVLDMMEPQDHPNDFAYPGGPPNRPYDNAGWTLAYEMGVKFDRVLDAFDAPNTKQIRGTELAKPLAGTVAQRERRGGLPDVARGERRRHGHEPRLQGGRRRVLARSRRSRPAARRIRPGTYYVPAASRLPCLQKSAADLGVSFVGVTSRPADAMKLPAKRIALYDRYGGSMPSGWTRSSSRISRFRITVVYPKDLDAGNLKSQVRRDHLPVRTWRSAARAARAGGGGGGGGGGGRGAAAIPAEFQKMQGNADAGDDAAGDQAVPERRRHGHHGRHARRRSATRLVCRSRTICSCARRVKPDRALAGEEYYVPGSILRVAVDNNAAGRGGHADAARRLLRQQPGVPSQAGRGAQGRRRPSRGSTSATPLRSGWAWGQNYLEGGAAVVESNYRQGQGVPVRT